MSFNPSIVYAPSVKVDKYGTIYECDSDKGPISIQSDNNEKTWRVSAYSTRLASQEERAYIALDQLYDSFDEAYAEAIRIYEQVM